MLIYIIYIINVYYKGVITMSSDILVCVLGSGKGSWGHIIRLITNGEWKDIYLISNEWGKEKFAPTKEVSWIMINNNMGFELMYNTIKESVPDGKKISLNTISGDGKIHMATIRVVREKDPNFKLAILTKEGLNLY
jgi:hypothetical protein